MKFSREDWTLLRSVGSLGQMAGVPPTRLRRLVVKELADNALDAAGACEIGFTPSGAIYVRDEGPGLPGTPEDIAQMFSIRRPLESSKLLRLPTRGALGNGLRVVAGAVLASQGSLDVWTKNQHLSLRPLDSGSTDVTVTPSESPIGTRIQIKLGAAIPPDGTELEWGKLAAFVAGKGTTYRGRTSAWWYDAPAFFELCQAAGAETVRELIAQFEGCTGGKAGDLTQEFKGRRAADLRREECSGLLERLRAATRPVRPNRLGTIGPNGGLGDAHVAHRGVAQLATGVEIPFVAEVWATQTDWDEVTLLVNRTPVTGDIGVQRMRERAKLGIFGCGVSHAVTVGTVGVRLVINLTAPYIPITTDGKEPDLRPFLEALLGSVERATKAARRPRRAVISQKDAILDVLDEEIAGQRGTADHRYSLRQLYYAIRPRVAESCGAELKYDHFTSVIGDEEQRRRADLPGLYRDIRGSFYHPHTGEEIALGTLEVEQYRRPDWSFNKVLYCEKEGLIQQLRHVKWPERHDCALMTSKGYASRAARDLLDLLGDHAEQTTFFCAHDADAAGTCIYQGLQQATRSRGARKFRIIDLGLHVREALEMGLAVETLERSPRVKPVGSNVSETERDWLQTHRIELNAMNTERFIEWLDLKMRLHGQGKLVPPVEVLAEHHRVTTEARVRKAVIDEILRSANVDGLVAERVRVLPPNDQELGKAVVTAFEVDGTCAWRDVVEDLVEARLGGDAQASQRLTQRGAEAVTLAALPPGTIGREASP